MTLEIIAPPRGVFRGANFMTPRPLEYYRRTLRGRSVYVELSEGEGFDHSPLYGVTFRFADGGELWRDGGSDPSRCFHSRSAALEWAREAE